MKKLNEYETLPTYKRVLLESKKLLGLELDFQNKQIKQEKLLQLFAS